MFMLNVVTEDLRDEYDPAIHADIDDLRSYYIDPQSPGPFMLVAQTDLTNEIIATCGIRSGELKSGFSPPHLVRRYQDGRTGQLVRVYVSPQHRRRGIAAALTNAALTRVDADGHFDRIALHTYPHSPGALPFWISMGAEVVAQRCSGGTTTVYMELPVKKRIDLDDVSANGPLA